MIPMRPPEPHQLDVEADTRWLTPSTQRLQQGGGDARMTLGGTTLQRRPVLTVFLDVTLRRGPTGGNRGANLEPQAAHTKHAQLLWKDIGGETL